MPRRKTPGISSYVAEIKAAGKHLTETHLYQLFTEHIVKAVLGYEPGRYNLTLPRPGQEGIPDLCLRDGTGERWIEVEAKLDDKAIRSAQSRSRLWADKQKYVTGVTVHFLWFAPRTILVCDPQGNLQYGVYLDEQSALEIPVEPSILVTRSSDEVRRHLSLISAEAAEEAAYLEDFAQGKVPGGYIPADAEHLPGLTGTLEGITNLLNDFFSRRWQHMHKRYEEYEAERRQLAERHDDAGDLIPARRKQVEHIRLRRGYEHEIELMETAFPQFEQEQAYTRYQQRTAEPIPEALRRIFVANAAYVVLGRLLFVRFAEDMGLAKRKLSNGGLTMWNELVGQPKHMVYKLIDIAFLDSSDLFEQFFDETPFDALWFDDDPEFNEVLHRVLYRLSRFDFGKLDQDVLGGLYQGILPRDKRKALGEFYTDPEVIEYILERVGFREAIAAGESTRLLDPACGSGGFLVQAAAIMREEYEKRGVEPAAILDIVSDSLHGIDINHFAIFISQMNLLFSLFDFVAKAQKAVTFPTQQANSLLRNERPQQMAAHAAAHQQPSLRDETYAFVVGNPPYVRHERLPGGDRDELREAYSQVCRRNADLATFFLRRGPDWLEPNGVLGMIVSRGLTDSGYANALRRHLMGDDLTIRELVPLDWCCRELFDSDVVPVLVFIENRPRLPDHHVRLVQRVGSLGDLVECARNRAQCEEHACLIRWEDFVALSEAAWPLEVRPEDVPILRKLQGFERLGKYANAQYAIKVGARGRASECPEPGLVPMLVGSDISSFGVAVPQRFVDLGSAENLSIWRAVQDDKERTAVPPAALAVVNISVTVNAAVLDPQAVAAQDTIIVVTTEEGHQAKCHALAALVNNACSRYFAFLLLRSAVTGGGRRDYHIYPRTLEALPVPVLSGAEEDNLAGLSAQAHELGRVAAQDRLLLWQELVGGARANRRLATWGLDFSGWGRGAKVRADGFDPELTEDRRLVLGENATLRGDEALLQYAALALEVALSDCSSVSKGDAQGLMVPPVEQAEDVMAQYQKAVDRQEAAKEEYFAVVAQIDEAVMDAFGLSDEERAVIRRRMDEFPLKEHAANFRLPWEQTRRPRLRHFEPGERFRS
ncbi:MAG: class I SAM-dependent DNA methyltransferase [Armatimonadota bacterium]